MRIDKILQISGCADFTRTDVLVSSLPETGFADYLTNVDTIEEQTGLDLFAALEDEEEAPC